MLEFKPSKGKQLTLLSSHLLSNGVVGGVEELAEGACVYVCMCGMCVNIAYPCCSTIQLSTLGSLSVRH